jgi:uncharacterized protein (DUF1778 family)
MQPVSVRLTKEERTLLSSAAELACMNISEFIRRHAIEAAEIEFSERRTITISAADWDRFEAWCCSAGTSIVGLRRLACARPDWD